MGILFSDEQNRYYSYKNQELNQIIGSVHYYFLILDE